jgi:hypothetical protein
MPNYYSSLESSSVYSDINVDCIEISLETGELYVCRGKEKRVEGRREGRGGRPNINFADVPLERVEERD